MSLNTRGTSDQNSGVHEDTHSISEPGRSNYYQEETSFINRDNIPQSMSSDASDMTFYTANSQPIEGSSGLSNNNSSTSVGAAPNNSPQRPYLVSKPLQILSRFTNSTPFNNQELSTSIDSGSDNNHDDKSTIESSATSIVELDHIDESTIDLSTLN